MNDILVFVVLVCSGSCIMGTDCTGYMKWGNTIDHDMVVLAVSIGSDGCVSRTEGLSVLVVVGNLLSGLNWCA